MILHFYYLGWLDEFVAVNVNQMGMGLGMRGLNGSVSFYSRQGFFTSKRNGINKDIVVNETELGFDSVSEKYENTMMVFPNELARKQYGTADWIPNFDINNDTSNTLKVNTNGFKNLKLFVNGMNANGDFIYKVVNIQSNPN